MSFKKVFLLLILSVFEIHGLIGANIPEPSIGTNGNVKLTGNDQGLNQEEAKSKELPNSQVRRQLWLVSCNQRKKFF